MGKPLVSIGLPVRNGEPRVRFVVESILAQDYTNLEIVISDNASADATEDICRELVHADARVVYYRQPENVGVTRNFISAMNLARGEYFRWIGHDDALAPGYLSQTLPLLVADRRLVLVTSQIAYELDDGSVVTSSYDPRHMASDDPAERFVEMVRLLNAGFAVLDPLYSLMDRRRVALIPRRNMLREDEVFATKLALSGPWGHVPEVLATRGWSYDGGRAIARRLDVPQWNAYISWALQVQELRRVIRASDLDAEQRRRARAAVQGLYVTRHRRRVDRAWRKIGRLRSGGMSGDG
jgi:glycosyltransferase involved in cell wall biosynthesis